MKTPRLSEQAPPSSLVTEHRHAAPGGAGGIRPGGDSPAWSWRSSRSVHGRSSCRTDGRAGSQAASAGESAKGDVEAIVAEGERRIAAGGPLVPRAGSSSTGRTVLLLHGFAETSRALEAARGGRFEPLRLECCGLDSRGHGQSEGHYSTFGGLEARDIRVWLDELSPSGTDRAGAFVPAGARGAARSARPSPCGPRAVDSRTVALVLEAPMVDIVASTATVLRSRRLPFPKFLAGLVVRRAGKLAGMPH